jgi:hypothetical protein
MLCKGTAGRDEDMLGGSMEAVFDDAFFLGCTALLG